MSHLRVCTVEGHNFRNYTTFRIEPHPRFNVISGRNAQGKSNFIEAVYFALRGFSLRAARADEVVLWGSPGARILADVEHRGMLTRVLCVQDEKGKKLSIAGQRVSQEDFASCFGAVLFTPDDLLLLKGGPQERRRFLDFEMSAFSPGYSAALREYRRALSQRNALLRTVPGDKDSFELWTERLTALGGELIMHRLQVLKKVTPLLEEMLREWGSGEEVSVRYRSAAVLRELTAAGITEALREALEQSRSQELKMGQTMVGPHRDDLVVLINGRDARTFGSQGQQRSIVLALKLCQAALWKDLTGETPVVLLDDVFFELDQSRRRRILERLGDGAQVFVTVGDSEIPAGKEGKFFRVENGSINLDVGRKS
ncbi:MAG: DNA replication/repair protein RecF [Bacillota bacterium]